MVRRWQCCGRAGAPGKEEPWWPQPAGSTRVVLSGTQAQRGSWARSCPASGQRCSKHSSVRRDPRCPHCLLPIAFSPYLALGVVALPTDECPLRLRVPNLGRELLVRSCSTVSPGAARELQPLAQRQSQHRRSNGSLKKAKQTPHFSLKPALKI